MRTNLFFRSTLAISLVSFVGLLFPQLVLATHTGGSGNPLPHATVKVWDTRPSLGFDPDDSVEDLAGLTVDVATVAAPLTIATAWENTSCPGGPCGAMLWNPVTDDFHCWGVTFGFTASIDLNTSAPVLTDGAGRTYQPGDIWVGGPNGAPLYVKFKSAVFHPATGSARIYFPVGSVWDVLVDQGTGEVWVSSPFSGFISKIDPTTGVQTRWAVGGQPRELAQDSSGLIYATAGTAGIVRLNPITDDVRKWAVAGLDTTGASLFATPDGIHIDSGGDVWFTESVSSEIGRLNPTTGVITEYTKAGLSNPQLIATSGSGAKLQAFFTEGSGNSLSVLTDIEAVGTATAVTPVDSTVTPTTSTIGTADRALSFRNVTITPVVHDVEGVDGGPDALGTTFTAGPDGTPGNADDERIPGLLRFPLSPTIPGFGFPGLHFPSGMTGVALPNTIFGAFLGSDQVFEASSLAIIAPVPRVGIDHFKCYQAEGNEVELTVSLVDQFGSGLAEVEEPELFCNPVDKNDEGISDETAHLTAYALGDDDEDFEPLEVTVTNQFGEEQVMVLEERELLFVPSEKDGVPSGLNLDHFQCYKLEDGDDLDMIVSLQDQFGFEPEDVLVRDAELFCNPVDKNGEGISDETAHLTCYNIEAEEVDRGVLTINQLDNQFLELEEAELLCVPSEKLAVAPAGDDDN